MKQLKGPLVINRTTHRKRPKVIIISVINYMMSADVDTPLVSRYIFNLSIFNYLYNHTWKVCGNLATGFHNLEPIFRFWSHFWSRFSDLGANNWVWKKLSKKLLIKTSLKLKFFLLPTFLGARLPDTWSKLSMYDFIRYHIQLLMFNIASVQNIC